MWSGIDPELQELLGFAWELTNYLDIKSPWRTAIFAVDRNKLQSTSVRVLSFDAVVPISGLMINCSYLIFSKWWIVPPRCTTEASWLRRTPDWHVAANGELCWVYGPYWRDVLQGMLDELETHTVRQTAAYWFAEKSADLINRHLIADRLLLKEWPRQWPAWAHGDAAVPQYEQMKQKGRIDRDIRKLLAAETRTREQRTR
jgi:hypothetical protein